MCERAALIYPRQVKPEKLLTLLQSTPDESDRFVSHLYQARRTYRRTGAPLVDETI